MISKISVSHFILHPLSSSFSKKKKAFAFCSTIILGIFTAGIGQIICKVIEKRAVKEEKTSQLFQQVIDHPLEELKKVGKLPNGEDIRGKKWFDQDHVRYFYVQLQRYQPDLLMPTVGITPADQDHYDYTLNDIEKNFHKYSIPSTTKYIAFPIYGGNHFHLLFIDRELKTVEYFDSLYQHDYTAIAKIMSKIDNVSYNVVRKLKQPIQLDSYQCGPWTCFFLEQRLKNPAFDFNSLSNPFAKKMIAHFRNKVILDISDYQRKYMEWQRCKVAKYRQHMDDYLATEKFNELLKRKSPYEIVQKIYQ